MSGINFASYHSNLVRVNLTLALIDEHRRAQLAQTVKSSRISQQHLAWAQAHAERRRAIGPTGACAEFA